MTSLKQSNPALKKGEKQRKRHYERVVGRESQEAIQIYSFQVRLWSRKWFYPECLMYLVRKVMNFDL